MPETMSNKRGKRKGLICFSISDIAKRRGVTNAAVRKARERGVLDIEDVESVYGYMLKIDPLFSEKAEPAPKRNPVSDTLSGLGITPNAAKIHKRIIEEEKPKKKVCIPEGADPKTYTPDEENGFGY